MARRGKMMLDGDFAPPAALYRWCHEQHLPRPSRQPRWARERCMSPCGYGSLKGFSCVLLGCELRARRAADASSGVLLLRTCTAPAVGRTGT